MNGKVDSQNKEGKTASTDPPSPHPPRSLLSLSPCPPSSPSLTTCPLGWLLPLLPSHARTLTADGWTHWSCCPTGTRYLVLLRGPSAHARRGRRPIATTHRSALQNCRPSACYLCTLSRDSPALSYIRPALITRPSGSPLAPPHPLLPPPSCLFCGHVKHTSDSALVSRLLHDSCAHESPSLPPPPSPCFPHPSALYLPFDCALLTCACGLLPPTSASSPAPAPGSCLRSAPPGSSPARPARQTPCRPTPHAPCHACPARPSPARPPAAAASVRPGRVDPPCPRVVP